jgi:hypothetical protein
VHNEKRQLTQLSVLQNEEGRKTDEKVARSVERVSIDGCKWRWVGVHEPLMAAEKSRKRPSQASTPHTPHTAGAPRKSELGNIDEECRLCDVNVERETQSGALASTPPVSRSRCQQHGDWLSRGCEGATRRGGGGAGG